MKKKILLAIILLTVLVFTGCANGNKSSAPSVSGDKYNYSADSTEDAASSEVSVSDRKIIQTVTYRAQTKEFDTLVEKIREVTEQNGGYVENSTVSGREYNSSSNRYATFKVRIPVSGTDSFYEFIENASNVTSKQISTDDITLKYVDTESRISALEAEKESLEAMLKKATSTSELLSIRTQLTDVIYRLDSYKSQLKTYDNLVEYVTVNITINEVSRITVNSESNSIWSQIGAKLTENFASVGDFLADAFVFLITSIPYLLLLCIPAGIVFLVIFLSRRKKRKKNSSQDN